MHLCSLHLNVYLYIFHYYVVIIYLNNLPLIVLLENYKLLIKTPSYIKFTCMFLWPDILTLLRLSLVNYLLFYNF